MHIKIIIIMFLASKLYTHVEKIPADYGYRHLALRYQNDPVDVIIIAKKGEERLAKPLFIFCQGSVPQPVIKYDAHGAFGVLPFNENLLLDQFHVVVVSQPFIPVIAHVSKLGRNYMYLRDFENEIPPKGYSERNYLDYYVFRNNFVVKQLFKERWVKASGLVVAGHSEGSTIAAKMASVNNKVSRLIYVAGNPYGRIASMVSTQPAEDVISYWKEVVANKSETVYSGGDSSKATYSFSLPQKDNLLRLTIPVMVCYGSLDDVSNFLQLLQIEAIREQTEHITFQRYQGLDHNFFEQVAREYHWDSVADDWNKWMNS